MTTKKTSHDNDYMDFSKLEKEIENAVVSEERYWRENDAKIRAVEQRVPTYDDFREMVLAAHLKPLEEKDKISSIGTFTQVWNQSAQKLSKSQLKNEQLSSTEQNSVAALPKSSKEFILHWRHHCKTSKERKHFLFTVGAKCLAEIFRIEIGELLGEFLECLLCLEDEEADLVVELLEMLSKSQRFALSLAFLSKKQQESCKLLFQKLKDCPHGINSTSFLKNVTRLENFYCKC